MIRLYMLIPYFKRVYHSGMIKPVFAHHLSPDEKALREEIFVKEEGFDDEFDEIDQDSWHLVLYHDSTPIAVGRIQEKDPETYQIERVAVKKEYRGHKIGSYLMKFLEGKIKEIGGRKAILLAQADKEGFYLKNGYRPVDGEIVYEENYPHVKMEKALIKDCRKYRR